MLQVRSVCKTCGWVRCFAGRVSTECQGERKSEGRSTEGKCERARLREEVGPLRILSTVEG
jgi:hypothetical protein